MEYISHSMTLGHRILVVERVQYISTPAAAGD
jgi:hypothetical protein